MSNLPDRAVLLLDGAAFRIPAAAATLAGFRAWALSEEFPERGRISFIDNAIFVDLSPEEIESHNKVKSEISRVVSCVVHEETLGTFFSDRSLLTNETAGLSTEPDAMFAAWETLRSGRLRRVPLKGKDEGCVEVVGTPDWVLEVVSRSSVRKDTVILRDAYGWAGVPEFWLVDALGKRIEFQILVLAGGKYTPAPRERGWTFSPVFQRSFRLARERDPLGDWLYTLHVRGAPER